MKKILMLGAIMIVVVGCSNSKKLNINSKDNLVIENINSDKRDLEDIIIFNQDGVTIRREGKNLILSMEEHILFDIDKSIVKEGVKTHLDTLSKALFENRDLRIKIDGYTCNLGSENYNLKLSLNRAKSIKEYLVENKVPSNSITVEGYGESDPIENNTSEVNRAQNRRVEFIISRAY